MLLASPLVAATVLDRDTAYHALEDGLVFGRWRLVDAGHAPSGLCLDCFVALELLPDPSGATSLADGEPAGVKMMLAGSPSGRAVHTMPVGAWYDPAVGVGFRLLLGNGARCAHDLPLPTPLSGELRAGRWRGRDQLRLFAGPPEALPRSPAGRPQPLVFARD